MDRIKNLPVNELAGRFENAVLLDLGELKSPIFVVMLAEL